MGPEVSILKSKQLDAKKYFHANLNQAQIVEIITIVPVLSSKGNSSLVQ